MDITFSFLSLLMSLLVFVLPWLIRTEWWLMFYIFIEKRQFLYGWKLYYFRRSSQGSGIRGESSRQWNYGRWESDTNVSTLTSGRPRETLSFGGQDWPVTIVSCVRRPHSRPFWLTTRSLRVPWDGSVQTDHHSRLQGGSEKRDLAVVGGRFTLSWVG